MRLLWKRYFFKELIKVFFLFIGAFYFLYVLIDYSIHTKIFQNSGLSFLSILFYYLCQFTKRADILIPVALTIAVVKVLTTSNLRNELLALTVGGLSLKKILQPFFWWAALCTVFLYLNFQFLQPQSLNWIDAFEQTYFHNQMNNEDSYVNSLTLEDSSLLIYRSFEREKRCFHDAYWLKNSETIYRIQTLYAEKTPFGFNVDLLEKNEAHEILKRASYETLILTDLHIDLKGLSPSIYPASMQSITQLFHSLKGKDGRYGMGVMSNKEAALATYFYFKMLAPMVCFFAILGPAPFCLRFTRHLPTFFIFAFSLFGLIAFFTLTKSSLLIGAHQVFPPLIAILLPQTLALLILLPRYAKL